MMNERPFATIIVPTYNQAVFLGDALDSLLAQTDSNWEAIVVNDGSTDHTAQIAEEYTRRDSRIRYIHKSNGGVASALNVGLKNARGEWIHWLSSDDLFERQKLAINRLWIKRHPDCNFFFSYFTLLREVSGVRERRELWGPLPDPEHQILTLFYRNYVSGISICIKQTAWEEAGFFDESLYYAQDYGQWLRLLQKGQAVFIPEWMVISRNHAAQGSETFPDACYFDTAKAAITFINQHSFTELVPWANLSDSASATSAVTYALDVACDRTAFLYCLGSHPAMVLRVLEWVFSARCCIHQLRTLVQRRIAEMSFVEGDDDWAWMWRQLALAVHRADKVKFPYSPVDTTQLALREYQSRVIHRDTSAEALCNYLRRFEDVDVEDNLPPAKRNDRIAFLIDRPFESQRLFAAADQLARRGYRALWLTTDAAQAEDATPTLQWHTWVPMIRVAAFDRDTLPWLGEVEQVVSLPGSTQITWLGSLSRYTLAEGLSTAEIEQVILTALGHGAEQPVRPVVFLERILWGGGAERVVFDIVRHLNRRRYRPVILTMFHEHSAAPKLPTDVEFLNIRCKRIEIIEKTAPPARRAHWVHRVYHRLLTQEIRKQIGLGRRLVALKQRVSASIPRREHKAITGPAKQADAQDSATSPVLNFDFISAMAHHNPAAVELARTMSQIGEDAVLVSVMEEATVTAWLAQAALPFPYVASLHSFESACMRDIYQTPSRLAAEWRLLSAACNDAEVVTLPSQGCCRDLKENFSVAQARVMTMWNPVDCARVRRLSFQRIEAVEQWRNNAHCLRLVHVGRLDTQKNHALLLSVCSELKKRGRKFSLMIVGEGHDRPNIEKRILKLGLGDQVTLVGAQNNPFPWIAAADALLLTSRFEAFALVLVEAMACGTPVISVDCPAGPAEVLNNGEFGLLTPNDDPLSLADAVEGLMDDPSLALRMSDLGYDRAQAFDVKKIVPQWEALIDALPMATGKITD